MTLVVRARSASALGLARYATAAVALPVIRARMLHTGPLLRKDAALEKAVSVAAPAPTGGKKRAALEDQLVDWQGQVQQRFNETADALRTWLKSPADIALKKSYLAANDTLASAQREYDVVLTQLELQAIGAFQSLARTLTRRVLQRRLSCARRPASPQVAGAHSHGRRSDSENLLAALQTRAACRRWCPPTCS
jgi:hypothetical protein